MAYMMEKMVHIFYKLVLDIIIPEEIIVVSLIPSCPNILHMTAIDDNRTEIAVVEPMFTAKEQVCFIIR